MRLEEEKETSYSLFAKLERQGSSHKVLQEENLYLKTLNEELYLENTLLRNEIIRCRQNALIESKKSENLVPSLAVENLRASATKLTTDEVAVAPSTLEKPLQLARRSLKRPVTTSADTQQRKWFLKL